MGGTAQALGLDCTYAVADGPKRPSSAPPGSRKPQLGDNVRISGMSRRRELNGASGILVNGVPDEAGRLSVHIQAPSPLASGFGTASLPDVGKVMRIKADR